MTLLPPNPSSAGSRSTATATATAPASSQLASSIGSTESRFVPQFRQPEAYSYRDPSLPSAYVPDVSAAQEPTTSTERVATGTSSSGREGTVRLPDQQPSTTGPLRSPANLPSMGTSSTAYSPTSVPAQYAFTLPSQELHPGIAGPPSPEPQCSFLANSDKDAYCLTPKRHVRSRSLAGTLGAPHMSRAHSSPSLIKGRGAHPYHHIAGPAYSRPDEFGSVTSSPYRQEHLQPALLLRTPHSQRDQDFNGHGTTGMAPSPGEAMPGYAYPMPSPTSPSRHEHELSSRPSSRHNMTTEEVPSPLSTSAPIGSHRTSNRHGYQNTFNDLNIPPIGSPGGFHGVSAKFNEPYPNPLTTSSMPSSPSTLRSRSPSISSLETIPDIPDAEAEAVALDDQAANEAQDRRYPWLTSSSTNLLGSTTPRFGSMNRKDKRKRWSVCGGEKAYDFDLETIWED